jgi:hypothetical protein
MWLDIVIVALFMAGGWAFAELVGWRTRMLTRKTRRRAEYMYGQYADSPRKQRRVAASGRGGASRVGPVGSPPRSPL